MYVFYHYPCNDGELSSIIWKYFNPDSILIKYIHHDNNNLITFINYLDKTDIIFLDITPNFSQLTNIHNYIVIRIIIKMHY